MISSRARLLHHFRSTGGDAGMPSGPILGSAPGREAKPPGPFVATMTPGKRKSAGLPAGLPRSRVQDGGGRTWFVSQPAGRGRAKVTRVSREWATMTSLSLLASVGPHTMNVTVLAGPPGSGMWAVAAFESLVQPEKDFVPNAKGVNDLMGRVFDNHSHEQLGVCDLPKAIRIAEKYARAWTKAKLAGKKPPHPCDCVAISSTKKRRARKPVK